MMCYAESHGHKTSIIQLSHLSTNIMPWYTVKVEICAWNLLRQFYALCKIANFNAVEIQFNMCMLQKCEH